jgi:hypothetical protein
MIPITFVAARCALTRARRHFFVLASALLGALAFVPAPVQAAPFSYALASQQEWGRRRGFKLGFEDNSPTPPRKKETLRLILSVADGKSWRFTTFAPTWQWDRDYKVRAVIGTKSASLWVDGKLILESAGGFVPSDTLDLLRAGFESRKNDTSGEYRVQQTALRYETDKQAAREAAFTPPEKWPLALFLLEPQTPVSQPWKMTAGESLTIEASFRILRGDVETQAKIGPFVDRFGQARAGEWPGKIHSEAEMKRAQADEARRHAVWGTPTGNDAFGGSTNAGWSENPTGFFRTTQRNGFWWLISPLGNPCFYVGVDTVTGTFEKTAVSNRAALFEGLPPRTGEFAPAYSGDGKTFGFTTANLIRKYGADWENAAWKEAGLRLKTWGFSVLGKWSGSGEPLQIPVQPVLRRTGVPTLGRLPDVFDANIRAALRASLEKSIGTRKTSPQIIGWSLGNEHDEVVLKSDIESILKKPETVPAKRALVAHALEKIYGGDAARLAVAWKVAAPVGDGEAKLQALAAATPLVPAEDIETLRRHFADEYYGFVYRTVKEIDPNHLYFGFWIVPGWWENEEDWKLMARHCDVIGYDFYGRDFADERLARLLREAGKPAMCGEFSFPSWYRGLRGYGAFEPNVVMPDGAAAGEAYARYVEGAARNPYCVGVQWFQYRDQPITGRGPVQDPPLLAQDEHFAFGLVDITDQPKWDMIERMRRANLSAVTTRLQASRTTQTKAP